MTSPSYTLQTYQEAADFVQQQSAHRPKVGLILGSGLSPLADAIDEADRIPYGQIPHFPISTVEGHAGQLVLGRLAGVNVCAMQGRFHFYEGYTLQQTTFPVRVMKLLGIDTLILTNAAGGINPAFRAGDLMVIDDHINFMGLTGYNPLGGPNLDAFGLRFPSMTDVYAIRLRQLADQVAARQGETLQHGVYAALSGPTFETPAEVRFLRAIGVDAVGMSTAPEAAVARHAGMQVLGISTITNVAIDVLDSDAQTSHEEVLETGKAVVPRLTRLLMGILEGL
jgi:purine-nucleoside phosphorylase